MSAPVLMSDAYERAYLRIALADTAPLSFKKGLRQIARSLRRGVAALSHGVADVINAQAETRARSQRYGTRLW